MSNLQLRYFRLSGAWEPLFRELPGWRVIDDHAWSDEASQVIICPNSRDVPGVGFSVRGLAAWQELMRKTHAIGTRNATSLVVRTPGAGTMAFNFVADETAKCLRRSYIMNHVALNVAAFSVERAWLQMLLGVHPVLARECAWEPTKRAHLADCHWMSCDDYYVVLRSCDSESYVDHIGWMVESRAVVDEFFKLVARLRWSVVFGPEEIDGSYLFHFVGPDGRIHDFFHVSDHLRHRRSDCDY